MDPQEWLAKIWIWLVTKLNAITRRKTGIISGSPSTVAETSVEEFLEKLRRDPCCIGDYDLHDILRRQTKVEWPEWHLNIDENDKAIEIAQGFHKDFKKLKLSSTIVGHVRTIEETFLAFTPNDRTWNKIRNDFKAT